MTDDHRLQKARVWLDSCAICKEKPYLLQAEGQLYLCVPAEADHGPWRSSFYDVVRNLLRRDGSIRTLPPRFD